MRLLYCAGILGSGQTNPLIPLSRPFGSRYLGFMMKVSIKLSKANRISSIHLIHSCIHSMILAHFLLKSNAPTSHSLQLHTINPPRCVFRTCVQTHLSSNSNKQPPLYSTQTQNTHKQTNKQTRGGKGDQERKRK